MVFINSLAEKRPVVRDTSVVIEMAVNSPEKPFVNRLLPIMGTAVVSGGPFFPIDLGSYRLDYGIGDDPKEWHQIGSVHTEEARDSVLETWDTDGLESGQYVLKLTAFLSEEDSLEAHRGVYLREEGPIVGDVTGGRTSTTMEWSMF
ncbi:MAG: hypothetical protein ACE5OR_13040 [bacterium]